jgi:hypothetical protein
MISLEKSLSPFKSLVAFEFSKYSSCFEVINQITDSSGIHIFEVSPTPMGGILILTADSAETISSFYSTQKLMLTASLIDSCVIHDLNEKVLTAYLSQNVIPKLDSLIFFESNSLCQTLVYSQNVVSSGGDIVDFRVIRSTHNRAILVYSGILLDHKSVQLSKLTALTKSYFEILK